VRQSERWFSGFNSPGQFYSAPYQASHFKQFMFSMVSTNLHVIQMKMVRKLTRLSAISCSQHDFKPPEFEFIDNGSEEKNMWCIVEINPNHIFHGISL
jgi:hypothetical protein